MYSKRYIPTRIYLLRKHLGYSQHRFASDIGVNFSMVSKWEHGMCLPSIEHLIKIANTYGLHMNYFFKEPKKKVHHED